MNAPSPAPCNRCGLPKRLRRIRSTPPLCKRPIRCRDRTGHGAWRGAASFLRLSALRCCCIPLTDRCAMQTMWCSRQGSWFPLRSSSLRHSVRRTMRLVLRHRTCSRCQRQRKSRRQPKRSRRCRPVGTRQRANPLQRRPSGRPSSRARTGHISRCAMPSCRHRPHATRALFRLVWGQRESQDRCACYTGATGSGTACHFRRRDCHGRGAAVAIRERCTSRP